MKQQKKPAVAAPVEEERCVVSENASLWGGGDGIAFHTKGNSLAAISGISKEDNTEVAPASESDMAVVISDE